ncbi:MAG: hypothetical protein ACXU86_08665 [Archangium sp.]
MDFRRCCAFAARAPPRASTACTGTAGCARTSSIGGGPLRRRCRLGSVTTKSELTISGVIAAGGELSANTIVAINEAAKDVPKQWKRYIAYKDMVKVGGSLAWRANNPGNLRDASTKVAKVPGATGTFAVFATMEEGRTAQKNLYLNKYGDQTVDEAVKALTPPSENNTAKYLKDLERQGVDLKGTVKSQIELIMNAIKMNEGVIPGKEVPRVP